MLTLCWSGVRFLIGVLHSSPGKLPSIGAADGTPETLPEGIPEALPEATAIHDVDVDVCGVIVIDDGG